MLQTAVEPDKAQKKRLFNYAFIIALGGFLTQFIVLGSQRLPALTLEPIRETLDVSYTEVGLITSWFTVFYAGGAFVWGKMTDALGAKKTLTIAAATAAVGMILFGLFAQYGLIIAIAVWCIAGFGNAGLFMATLPKLIAKWFAPDKRGFGMALVTPGGNVASIIMGLVIPPLVAGTDWQMSFVIVGAFFAVIAVFILICVKEDPAEMGLAPYGAPAGTQAAPKPVVEKQEKAEQADSKGSMAKVLKMPITWHFGIMYIIWQIGYMISMAYCAASMTFAGFSPAEAGLGITIGGVATIVFIQIWGNLSDRIERKTVIAIGSLMCAVLSIAYFFDLQAAEPSLYLCWALVALITASTGITTAILSAAGDCYKDDIRATGTGVISTLSIIGRYAGPVVAGFAIDSMMGNVAWAYVPIAVAMVVAALIALSLPKMRGTATADS